MSATETITTTKIKIRIGSFQIGANPGRKPCEVSQRLVLGRKCNKSEIYTVIPSSENSNVKFSSMGSKKCGLSEVGDGRNEKRRKMDRSVTQQCAIILKTLMTHSAGWVFNQPVDPVKLRIPDYFYIISEPMDLGTVKRKLNNHEYSTVDGFTAHVRLTFSNAMRYNPPDNNVYLMAKELSDLFDLEWAELEAKWNGERKNLQDRKNTNGIGKSTNNVCKAGIKSPTSYVRSDPQIMISAVEKQELKKQLLELLRGKVPIHLQDFLKKSGFDLQRVERIDKVLNALGDEDLWELKKIIRSSWMVRTAKVTPAKNPDHAKKPDHVGKQSQMKIAPKGIGNGIRSAFVSPNVIPPMNSATSICGSFHNMKCECNKRSGITHASRDISSDGSRDNLDVAMRVCMTKLHSDPQASNSEIESKGDESALHEDHMSSCPPVSTMDTATTYSEGWDLPSDVLLSPQKALRASLLKSRFADTILNAKQKALRDHGDKADPVQFKQEKKRLERQLQKERARIESQIRALEEARMRAEAERKLQREREREAARLALQQMVKTVEIDNDHKILKDLELLSGCSISNQYSFRSCESNPEVGSGERGNFSRPLEQLGLFMKNDYNDYMEDVDEEKGKVFS